MPTEPNEPTEMEAPTAGLSKPDHGDAAIHLDVPLEELIPAPARRSLANAPPLQETVQVKDPITGEMKTLSKGAYDHQQSTRAMTVAKAIMEEQQQRMRKQRQALEYNDQVLSYIECRKPSCLGPGIWIHGDPFQVLPSDRWESTYHQRGAYWDRGKGPFCQMCWERDRTEEALPVWYATRGAIPNQETIGFMANPRYVRTMTRAQYDKFAGKAAKQQPIETEATQEVTHA